MIFDAFDSVSSKKVFMSRVVLSGTQVKNAGTSIPMLRKASEN